MPPTANGRARTNIAQIVTVALLLASFVLHVWKESNCLIFERKTQPHLAAGTEGVIGTTVNGSSVTGVLPTSSLTLVPATTPRDVALTLGS
jgi:hypothetical protein